MTLVRSSRAKKRKEVKDNEALNLETREESVVEPAPELAVEAPKVIKPRPVMSAADIESRYQAHLEKIKRGGK